MAKRKQRRKTGPAPKLEDAKLRRQLLRLVAGGMSARAACDYVGIVANTVKSHRERDPKFDADWKRAKATRLKTITEMAFKHAKDDPRTALHLLGCLDKRYSKRAIERPTNVNVHAHINADPESIRTELVGILATLRDRAGKGEAAGIAQSGGGTVIDVGSRNGNGHVHHDDADAATIRLPEPDVQ